MEVEVEPETTLVRAATMTESSCSEVRREEELDMFFGLTIAIVAVVGRVKI